MQPRPDGPHRNVQRGGDLVGRQLLDFREQKRHPLRVAEACERLAQLAELGPCHEVTVWIPLSSPFLVACKLAQRATQASQRAAPSVKKLGCNSEEPGPAAFPTVERDGGTRGGHECRV